MPCKGLKNSAQGNALGGKENEDEDEYERLKAAEQRLIATESLVNVAEQRLKDTQSQGDDSPATPLRLTSSSAAINRSEAASHDEDEYDHSLPDGNSSPIRGRCPQDGPLTFHLSPLTFNP